MADTSIEWSDKVWNPVSGCTRVSAGCDNCYAVKMTARLEAIGIEKYRGLTVLNKAGDRQFNGKIKTHDDALEIPLKWKKPCRIFVNSMSDLFHRDVPFEFIDRVFAVMALCPQHIFQVLTKRPERMAEYQHRSKEMVSYWMGKFVEKDRMETVGRAFDAQAELNAGRPLPNVWLGVSAEDQKRADERIPHLLKCPAAIRFLSCEPLLGPVELGHIKLHDSPEGDTDLWPLSGEITHDGPGIAEEFRSVKTGTIDWVIAGGESGHNVRPMHPDWARSLRDQCAAAGVPFFFKQWGAWKPLSTTDGRQQLPFGEYVLPSGKSKGFGFLRAGKKAAGRLLDGVEHNAMPATAGGGA